MRISDWSSDVCSSDLHVSVLFDRTGVFQVRDLRLLVVPAPGLPAKLGQRHDRHAMLLGDLLQLARYVGDVGISAALILVGVHELEIVDADQPQFDDLSLEATLPSR